MRFTAKTVVQQRDGDIFTRLDDDLLAVDSERGLCYSLTGPATRIWELIADPTEVELLCTRLRGEFEVDPATCQADVIQVLSDLYDHGLLTLPSEEPAPHGRMGP